MKKYIYWGAYFTAASVFNIVLLIACKESLNVSGGSVFPAAYIVAAAFLAWFYPSQFRYDNRFLFRSSRPVLGENSNVGAPRIKYQKGDGFSADNGSAEGYQSPEDKFLSKAFLVCIPFLVPFFFFTPLVGKIICGGLLIIPRIAALVYTIIVKKKEAETYKNAAKRAMEEQQRREELGRWK